MSPTNCPSILNSTCLKPQYSLRRQIVSSYASVVCVTTVLVVAMAVLAAIRAGNEIQDSAWDMLEMQIANTILESNRYGAEIFTERFNTLRAKTALISEIVRDRIVGYPNDGWEEDIHIPFENMNYDGTPNSKQRQYPLQGSLIPRDWNFDYNLVDASPELISEALQERDRLYTSMAPTISTVSAVYAPGNCYPICADHVIYDNSTASGEEIHAEGATTSMPQKAADIGIYLKAIFELTPEIASLGVYFINKGVGATVEYPAWAKNTSQTYSSAGCDWMDEINPNTKRPLGTEQEKELCGTKGTPVQVKNYKPQEQPWFDFFARNAATPRSYGPYNGIFGNFWWITIGQSIFDRRTGELIGVATVDLTMNLAVGILEEFKAANPTLGPHLEPAFVKLNGMLVAGAGSHSEFLGETKFIWETEYMPKPVFEQLTYDVVDWNSEWDPDTVRKDFSTNLVIDKDHNDFTAYPVPTPPLEYDPDYFPEFYLLVRVDREAHAVVHSINNRIDTDVNTLVMKSIAIGCGGAMFLLLVIWTVARLLTRPLTWMNDVSWCIVNHSDVDVDLELKNMLKDDEKQDKLDDTEYVQGGCTPKTEISNLVSEFSRMIHGFSGSGASSVASLVHEIRNTYSVPEEFEHAYSSTRSQHSAQHSERFSLWDLGSVVSTTDSTNDLASHEMENTSKQTRELRAAGLTAIHHDRRLETLSTSNLSLQSNGPKKRNKHLSLDRSCHSGPNINSQSEANDSNEEYFEKEMMKERGESGSTCWSQATAATVTSRLFLWMTVLLVMPLILTNVTISLVVRRSITVTFPSWMDFLKESSLQMEVNSLVATADLHAALLSSALKTPIDDMLFHSRVAGWVVFGAVPRSTSSTDTNLIGEQCKMYPDGWETCPYYQVWENRVCDCSWRDRTSDVCDEFSHDTRSYQRGFALCQRGDTDPITGNRNSSNYPSTAYSAATTIWWENVADMPGFGNNSSSSSYETTYDRFRVASALSVSGLPLYNYVASSGLRDRRVIAAFLAFEADGMFWGYGGCDYNFGVYAHYETEASLATTTRPELCPVGKYGYDPRCREWYAEGARAVLENGDSIYVTPPYTFASKAQVASSAGAILIDPGTNATVAHTVLDFSLDLDTIEQTAHGFSFMITPDSFTSGSDTVFGPGHKVGDKPKAVADIVLPWDSEGSANRIKFGEIVADMKHAGTDLAWFARTAADADGAPIATNNSSTDLDDEGTMDEVLAMTYSPVFIRSTSAAQADDYSRGIRYSNDLVYSLGFARTESSLREPFNTAEKQIVDELDSIAGHFVIAVAVVSVISILVTNQISIKVAKPMILLLHVVTNINMYARDSEIPPLNGGSIEVHQVYNSFAKLCKIVRVSNSAYFSGNLEWALRFLTDALRLYLKQGDSKAIAIACNNLGNTNHVLGIQQRRSGTCALRKDGDCAVARALENYTEAIRIGTIEYNADNPVEVKAEYGLQLADRHFNRGLCFLLSDGDPCLPEDARKLGYGDIAKAKSLHNESTDQLLERRKLLSLSDQQFDRLLTRINGLTDLYDDEQVREIWDSRVVLLELGTFLSSSWNYPNSPLFSDVSRVGRMQQIEAAAIRLHLATGNVEKAAQTALRMVVEDEYVIDNCFVWAAEALFRATQPRGPFSSWSDGSIVTMRAQLRNMLSKCKKAYVSASKNVVFCFELGNIWQEFPDAIQKVSEGSLSLYDNCSKYPDNIGVAAHESLILQPKEKGRQRELLELASVTPSRLGVNFLSDAVSMIERCSSSSKHDSIIIWVTDGSFWNHDVVEAQRRQVEKLNSMGGTDIHIMVLGLGIKSEEAKKDCTAIGRLSWGSKFIEATPATLESDFDEMSSVLFLHGCTSGNLIAHGVTVEKF